MMKKTLSVSVLLALAACGGGGSDGDAPLQTTTGQENRPVASTPGASPTPTPVAGQPPTSQPPAGRAPVSSPAPTPPEASPAPPEGSQPPVASNPPSGPAPNPPAAPTPPPSNRPVASPTSGSWVVACRQSHAPGGIVHGVVTTDGLFSVDDGQIDLTGHPAERQALVERDVYNPEVSNQSFRSFGTLTLVIGAGDDTRPRWVGAYDANPDFVRQWECSVILPNIAPAQQAMCYASKEPLTKGLGPPVIVGFDWMDSRVFVNRSDAPSVRYSLGQARDVTLPYEGRARDGTNLRCW